MSTQVIFCLHSCCLQPLSYSLTSPIITQDFLLFSCIGLALDLLGVALCSDLGLMTVVLSMLTVRKHHTWAIPGFQNAILVSAGLPSGSARICLQRRKGTYSFLSPPDSHGHFLGAGKVTLYEDEGQAKNERGLMCSSRGSALGQYESAGCADTWDPFPLDCFRSSPGLTPRRFGNRGERTSFALSIQGKPPCHRQEREHSPPSCAFWRLCRWAP